MRTVCIFCNTGHYIELFEIQLEIAQRHLDSGDHVHFVVCDGSVPCCEINLEKNLDTCLHCIGRRNDGLSKLSDKVKKIGLLSLLTLNDLTQIRSLRSEFQNLEELQNYKVWNFEIGKCVYSSVADIHRQYRPEVNRYQNEISRLIKGSGRAFLAFKRYIKEYSPSCVYVFNGRHALEFPVLAACKQAGISFTTHEQAYNGGFILCPNTQPQDHKLQIRIANELWDSQKVSLEEKRRIGKLFFSEKLGLRQGRISIEHRDGKSTITKNRIGALDNVNYQKKLPPSWNPSDHNVLIFQSSIFESSTAPEFYTHKKVYENQLLGIEAILRDCYASNPNIRFFLRLHPIFNLWGESSQDLRDFLMLENKFKNLFIIKPKEDYCSYHLMENASKVIAFISTTAIEAAYRKVPTIVLEEHTVSYFKCVHTPSNHREVISLITDLNLPPKDTTDCLKYGYYVLSAGIIPKYFKRNPNKSYEEDWGLFKGQKLQPRGAIRLLIQILHRQKLSFFSNLINSFLKRFTWMIHGIQKS